MSIHNLVDDLENTLGLTDEDDEFLQQICRDLEALCGEEQALNELPTLEKELEKQKELFEKASASFEADKAMLAKKIAEFEMKTLALAKQTAEQNSKLNKEMEEKTRLTREIQRLEQESENARRQIELERKAVEELTRKVNEQTGALLRQQQTATKTVATQPVVPIVSKSAIITLQKEVTISLEKCRSLQAKLKRHATVYGKQNDQFKRLQSSYKENKSLLEKKVEVVKKATALLPTNKPKTVPIQK